MTMAEYIEREALLKELKEKHDDMMQDEEYYGKRRLWHEALSHARVESIVECQPTADVVEVVRCKDCIYSEKICDIIHGEPFRVCNYGVYEQGVDDMHYCGRGAKMDGKEE